ncbi:MAG: bifunctional 4-hydroxy-2-oxoglutarate aldolase/2-dehydro-3-deoxy-phosphogluconate aldolase [Congregibacter sp.]
MTTARQILAQAPVVPVLSIARETDAVPLARALVDGGLPVLEVTLRTPVAFEAIRAIREEVPDAIVGAGTVLSRDDYQRAVDAGSRFIVSPGSTPDLFRAAAELPVPLIPGVATASELMLALASGFNCLKFFPAAIAGGPAAIKALSGPFPDVSFCPTGGVTIDNMADYFALPAVLTVGGTWLTPAALLDIGDWDAVRQLATEASDRVRRLRGD